MPKIAKAEELHPSHSNVLFITNFETSIGRPTGSWLYFLKKEADLQGIHIDALAVEDVDEKVLRKANYPIILIDMPFIHLNSHGFGEYVKYLVERAPSAKIIATTTTGEVDDARAVLLAGATDIVLQVTDKESMRNILKGNTKSV